jgi:hypothetical protein
LSYHGTHDCSTFTLRYHGSRCAKNTMNPLHGTYFKTDEAMDSTSSEQGDGRLARGRCGASHGTSHGPGYKGGVQAVIGIPAQKDNQKHCY